MEKKEPPIITSIRKINDKLLEELFKENPALEMLLTKDKNNSLKLLSKSIPLRVNKKVKINKEIIKIITDRKYL